MQSLLPLRPGEHLILYIQNHLCKRLYLLCQLLISFCIYRIICACVFAFTARSTSHSVYTESYMQALLPLLRCRNQFLYIQNHICKHFCLTSSFMELTVSNSDHMVGSRCWYIQFQRYFFLELSDGINGYGVSGWTELSVVGRIKLLYTLLLR